MRVAEKNWHVLSRSPVSNWHFSRNYFRQLPPEIFESEAAIEKFIVGWACIVVAMFVVVIAFSVQPANVSGLRGPIYDETTIHSRFQEQSLQPPELRRDTLPETSAGTRRKSTNNDH